MQRSVIQLLFAIMLSRNALAQPAGQPVPVTAGFLENHVADELARDRVDLTHDHLALRIEQLADRWLVSLIDLTTGRTAASTAVAALPADPDAAVATMTHVAAALVAQLSDRGSGAADAATAEAQIGAELDAREVAQRLFERRALRLVAYRGHGAVQIVRGDLDEPVDPQTFFNEIGRPDLAASVRTRQRVAIGALVVGAVAAATAVALTVHSYDSAPSCALSAPDFAACVQRGSPSYASAAIALGISGAAVFAGILVAQAPVGIDETRTMADEYNQRLRRQLGLPVVSQRPVLPILHDLQLAPYVAGSEAGLAMRASF